LDLIDLRSRLVLLSLQVGSNGGIFLCKLPIVYLPIVCRFLRLGNQRY
jgi:hypothetical protein